MPLRIKYLILKKKIKMKQQLFLYLLFTLAFINTGVQTLVVYGDYVTPVEINDSKDLVTDFKKVSREQVDRLMSKGNLSTAKYQNN